MIVFRPPTLTLTRGKFYGLWARISGWSKCRDQFPFYRELGQKRKQVCGLARCVVRCFLGSGVLTSRRPLYPERYGNFYRGIDIQNS